MSDILQIVLTAGVTLLGGVILFIFGEFAKVLIIQPCRGRRDRDGEHDPIMINHEAMEKVKAALQP